MAGGVHTGNWTSCRQQSGLGWSAEEPGSGWLLGWSHVPFSQGAGGLLPERLLIRVTGYGRFRLCRLHGIHAWQQLAHLREVTGDAVLLPGEVVDLAVGRSAAAFGISVDLGEQLLGLGLGLAGDLVGVLFCVADHLPGVLVGVPASLVGLGAGLRCPLL